jgi:hypothetical protein
MVMVRGIRKYKKGRIEVLLRIIEELSADYGEEIPETLVLDKALEQGVEDPEKKISFLKEHLAIIVTSPNTFKKAWPRI